MQWSTGLYAFENLLNSFLHLELPERSTQNVWREHGNWGRRFLFRRRTIFEDDNSTLGWFGSFHWPVTNVRRCRWRCRSLIEFEVVVRS